MMLHEDRTTEDLRLRAVVLGLSPGGSRNELLRRLADTPWEDPVMPTGYRLVLDSGAVVGIALTAMPLRAMHTVFVEALVEVPRKGKTPVVLSCTGRSLSQVLHGIRERVAAELGYAEFLRPGEPTRAELLDQIRAREVA